MKNFFAFLTVCMLGTVTVYAQYPFEDDLYFVKPVTYEVGASLGVMNCLTDLGGREGDGRKFVKDINIRNSQVDASIYATLMYKYAVGLMLEATFGHVKANDNDLEPYKQTTNGRFRRNLSFKSRIIEVALLAEIHPLFFTDYIYKESFPRLSPYITGGIGFFTFNPQAKLNDQWIDLQPLRTEGQGFLEYPDRKPYKRLQMVCPAGVGIKYKMTPLISISAECITRFLFTDYLDDVSTQYIDPTYFSNYLSGEDLSNALQLNDRQKEINPTHGNSIGIQRGNPDNNDAYFTFNIKIAALL